VHYIRSFLSSSKCCIIMSSLKQCAPVSGLVTQYLPASNTTLEADDFDDLADAYEYEASEQMYDIGDRQVEEILIDEENEDEEESEEDNTDDECYDDVDDDESVISLSGDEETVDAVDSDDAVNQEFCESNNSDDIEIMIPEGLQCARQSSRVPTENSSEYSCCFFNDIMFTQLFSD